MTSLLLHYVLCKYMPNLLLILLFHLIQKKNSFQTEVGTHTSQKMWATGELVFQKIC